MPSYIKVLSVLISLLFGLKGWNITCSHVLSTFCNLCEYISLSSATLHFKSDFLKYVLPTVEIEKAAFVLKSCLTGKARNIVESLDDDYEKILGRLDEKYGRPEKVADLILYEIRKQNPIKEDDNKNFVRFVDTIENGYWDLERLSMGNEISNSVVISLIEEKLPKPIKHEWARKTSKIDSTAKIDFSIFLEFLTKQRRIMEYENSEIRS